MPWKECDPMSLKAEFVVRAMRRDMPFVRLCEEFGITPKTGYKWQRRFLEEGLAGLEERSRRPGRSPQQLAEEVVCRIVCLKQAHRTWGPSKIRDLYRKGRKVGTEVPSLSSFKRVLDRAGLVERRRRRPSSQGGRLRYDGPSEAPNDLWTVDFKGWWYTCNGCRFEPLTVRDAASRYVLCSRALPDARSETVQAEFARLFSCYGLPLAMRMDNGRPWACWQSPLGLTRLSAWWVALGIHLDRIDPGRPDQNGAHERMHRDLALEVQRCPEADLPSQQASLDTWRRSYNQERPHEGLNMRRPAEVYRKSSRRYDGSVAELTYPAGMLARRVTSVGVVSIQDRRIPISRALAGWHVGLQPEGAGRYAAWFGQLCLGSIDVDSQSFEPVEGR